MQQNTVDVTIIGCVNHSAILMGFPLYKSNQGDVLLLTVYRATAYSLDKNTHAMSQGPVYINLHLLCVI